MAAVPCGNVKKKFPVVAKMMALVIAVVMCIGMSMVVFADTAVTTPENGFTVTITPNNQDQGTHTYEAYQIFAGTLAKDDNNKYILSNITWGTGITSVGQTALGDAAAYAKTLSGYTDNSAKALAAADTLSEYLNTTSGTYADGKITGLQPGYYLIKDTSSSPTGDDPKAQTRFILQVVADQTVTVKSSVPTVEKKVKEKNDTTGQETSWQDAADYDINDVIPYQITATIGDGIDNFEKYSLEFDDDMSKGLTLQEGWTIKIGDTDITSAFIKGTGTSSYEGGTMHTWRIVDLKSVEGITLTSGTKVVLSYTAKLNENAVIGSEGNPNKTVLKYDNNPNNCGNGTPGGTTPEDKVIVFTYEIKALKVQATSDAAITAEAYATLSKTEKADYVKLADGTYQKTTALKGAGFTLYKKVGDNWEPVGSEITGVTTFEFKGTDAGEYKLVETTVPAGFTKAADIEITVAATYDTESADPKLKSLTVTPETAGFTVAVTETKNDQNEVTEIVTNGEITGKILNQKGSVLPSTGGRGTTMIYIIGAALVIMAGVVLAMRKKMSSKES